MVKKTEPEIFLVLIDEGQPVLQPFLEAVAFVAEQAGEEIIGARVEIFPLEEFFQDLGIEVGD